MLCNKLSKNNAHSMSLRKLRVITTTTTFIHTIRAEEKKKQL